MICRECVTINLQMTTVAFYWLHAVLFLSSAQFDVLCYIGKPSSLKSFNKNKYLHFTCNGRNKNRQQPLRIYETEIIIVYFHEFPFQDKDQLLRLKLMVIDDNEMLNNELFEFISNSCAKLIAPKASILKSRQIHHDKRDMQPRFRRRICFLEWLSAVTR